VATHELLALRPKRTVVDRVEVLWTEGSGPRSVALMFRVGEADEPAVWGGVTQLLGHVVLRELDHPPLPTTGSWDCPALVDI
jgi:hypothetical protein